MNATEYRHPAWTVSPAACYSEPSQDQNRLLVEIMNKSNGQKIDYGSNVTDIKVDSVSEADLEKYPITVTAKKDGESQTFCWQIRTGMSRILFAFSFFLSIPD